MSETPPPRFRHVIDAMLIAVFAAALLLPLAEDVLGIDGTPAPRERRAMAKQPDAPRTFADLAAYPARFEAWLNDAFGFRNALLNAYSHLLVRGLCVSSNDQVALGRDGWLFFRSEVELYQRTAPTSPRVQEWAAFLEDRAAWHADRNIDFIVAIAPNKETIYAERLPARLTPAGNESLLDALVAHLRANAQVRIVDLRPVLRDRRSEGLLYDRTGTHWNDLGAFYAAAAILDAIRPFHPATPLLQRADYTLRIADDEGDDLARMLGLQSVLREPRATLRKRGQPKPEPLPLPKDLPALGQLTRARMPEFYRGEHPAGLDVIVYRDSFGDRLERFLTPHFATTLYLPPRAAYVIQRNPHKTDLVIFEMVERLLAQPPYNDDQQQNVQ